MATIVRNPEVVDYIRYMTLDEIAARPQGVMDLFEDGTLIILKDYRLDFDFGALDGLDNSTQDIEVEAIRRKLKKLEATNFFAGDEPDVVPGPDGQDTLRFANPVRQALFDHICRGDRAIYERASKALKSAHDELNRIFGICFPTYRPTRLIPSLRLTETLFENLHWDNHSIDDDFHQARIFCNLDRNKRLWNVGDRFLDYVETNYEQYGLDRFAGQDPNKMLDYILGDVLGGTREVWKNDGPRHNVAFEPGEVWLGESRMISHQIWYGHRAMVYMWFVDQMSMNDPSKRFNARIEEMHARKRAGSLAA